MFDEELSFMNFMSCVLVKSFTHEYLFLVVTGGHIKCQKCMIFLFVIRLNIYTLHFALLLLFS